MSSFLIFSALILVLLGIEWWRRSILARLAVLVLALFQLSFSEPDGMSARRAVLLLPREQRVLTLGPSPTDTLSDYQSGVLTMDEALAREYWFLFPNRVMSRSILVWLVLAPVLRRGVPKNSQGSLASVDKLPEPAA
jgi:hypothetical protein